MSTDATRATWKLTKKITAIQKLLLLSLADRAGESGECWPSLRRLMQDTNLDRKTIISNRQQLIEMGLIEYTNKFMGRSNQIPVMRLTYIEQREDEFTSPKSGTSTRPKSGTSDQSQKRDTEPKRFEPKNTTTASSSKITQKPQLPAGRSSPPCKRATLLELRNTHLPDDVRTDDEFIEQCETHLNAHSQAKYTKAQRLAGLKKIIATGCFDVPAGYRKTSDVSGKVKYSEYLNGIKNDIRLGLMPTTTQVMDFDTFLTYND